MLLHPVNYDFQGPQQLDRGYYGMQFQVQIGSYALTLYIIFLEMDNGGGRVGYLRR